MRKKLKTARMTRHLILSALCVATCAYSSFAQVKVSETQTSIPTYLVADPDVDPYFFTGRTYQGAAGHIYPYPIYDKLTDERVDKDYKYLTLENEYTSLGVLPEIGGKDILSKRCADRLQFLLSTACHQASSDRDDWLVDFRRS